MPAGVNSPRDTFLRSLRAKLGDNIDVNLSSFPSQNELTGAQEFGLVFRRKGVNGADASYSTRVSFWNAGTNQDEILLEAQGAGYNLYRGEVYLGGGSGKESTFDILNPYTTGTESYINRMAAAFQYYDELRGTDEERSVTAIMNAINQEGGYHGAGRSFPELPSSSTYLSRQTSLEELRFLSGTKRVSFSPELKTDEQRQWAMMQLLNTTAMYGNKQDRLGYMQGGTFMRDEDHMMWINKSALGSTYWDQNGNQQVSTLSGKPLTKSYPFGRRDLAKSYVRDEKGRYMTLEQAGIYTQQSTVKRDSWDQTRNDITISQFTPFGGLPMPGGYGKFQLPETVRQQVAGHGESARFAQGFESQRMISIRGINAPSDLLNSSQTDSIFHIQMPELMRQYGANQNVGILQHGGDKSKGIDPEVKGIEGGARPWMIEKMVMELPMEWWGVDEGQLKEDMRAQGIVENSRLWTEQITRNNILQQQRTNTINTIMQANNLNPNDWEITPGDSGEVRIGARIFQEDSAAIKSGGTKAYPGLGFVGSMRGKGFEIEQERQGGGFSGTGLKYNLLTESKSNAATMLGALEVMGKNTLKDYIAEAFEGPSWTQKVAAAQGYIDQSAKDGVNLQTLAGHLGIQNTEQLVGQLWNRMMDVGANGEMLALNGPVKERQLRRAKQYGIGRVGGWVSVGQMTDDTKERFYEEFEGVLRDERFASKETNQYNAVWRDPATQKMIKGARALLPGNEAEQKAYARQIFNQMYNFDQTDTINGVNYRTMRMNTEGVYSRRQLASVFEYAGGMDTVDAQLVASLEAQDMGGVVKWLEENQFNAETSSRASLRQLRAVRVAANSSLRKQNTLQLPQQLAYTVGAEVTSKSGQSMGKLTATEMRRYLEATTGTPGERLQAFSKYYQENVEKMGYNGMQMMWLNNAQVALPDPRNYLDIENTVLERGEGGQLAEQTNAHIADRALRYYLEGLKLEETGVFNPERTRRLNWKLDTFLKNPTSGKELNMNQVFQGTSGRYFGDTIIPEGSGFLPDEELRRLSGLFGLKGATDKELAQAFNVIPAIYMRDPMPVLGTNEYMGAIRPMRLFTSADPLGKELQGTINYGHWNTGPLGVNALAKSEQGDLDADPFRMIPLATFSMEKGKLKVNRWGTDADVNALFKRAAEGYGTQMQTQLYNQVFTGKEVGYSDPVRSPIIASILTSLQMKEDANPGSTILQQLNKANNTPERRWVTADKMKVVSDTIANYGKMRDDASAYDQNKGELMGQFYNTFKRWFLASGTELNMPLKQMVELSDNASRFYQQALDYSGEENPYSRMLNTIGIYKKEDPNAPGGIKYEINAMINPPDSSGKGGWAEGGLMDPVALANASPEERERQTRNFFEQTAGSMIRDPNAPIPYLARALAQTDPNDPKVYEKNVELISKDIERIRSTNYGSEGRRGEAMRAVIGDEWVKEGVVGWRSPYAVPLKAALTERSQRKDRVDQKGNPKFISEKEGMGLSFFIDKPYENIRELNRDVLPSRFIFDVLRNKSTLQTLRGETDPNRRLPQFLEPKVIQRFLYETERRGLDKHPMLREIRKNITDPLGFIGTQTGKTGYVRLADGTTKSYSNAKEFDQVVKDLNQSWNVALQSMFDPEADLMGEYKVGSSSIGSMSQFYRDNGFKNDRYGTTLSEGLKDALWYLDPELRQGMEDPGDFFEREGGSSRSVYGHTVEEALGENEAFREKYGDPIDTDRKNSPYWTMGKDDNADVKLSLNPDILKWDIDQQGNLKSVTVTDVKHKPNEYRLDKGQILSKFESEESYPLQMVSYMMGLRALATENTPETNLAWEKFKKTHNDLRKSNPNLPELTDAHRSQLANADIYGQWVVASFLPKDDEKDGSHDANERYKKRVTDLIAGLTPEQIERGDLPPGTSNEKGVIKTVPFGKLGDANVDKWSKDLPKRVEQAIRGRIKGRRYGARYASEVIRQELVRRGLGEGLGEADPEIMKIVEQNQDTALQSWAQWEVRGPKAWELLSSGDESIYEQNLQASYQRYRLLARAGDTPDDVDVDDYQLSLDEEGNITTQEPTRNFGATSNREGIRWDDILRAGGGGGGGGGGGRGGGGSRTPFLDKYGPKRPGGDDDYLFGDFQGPDGTKRVTGWLDRRLAGLLSNIGGATGVNPEVLAQLLGNGAGGEGVNGMSAQQQQTLFQLLGNQMTRSTKEAIENANIKALINWGGKNKLNEEESRFLVRKMTGMAARSPEYSALGRNFLEMVNGNLPEDQLNGNNLSPMGNDALYKLINSAKGGIQDLKPIFQRNPELQKRVRDMVGLRELAVEVTKNNDNWDTFENSLRTQYGAGWEAQARRIRVIAGVDKTRDGQALDLTPEEEQLRDAFGMATRLKPHLGTDQEIAPFEYRAALAIQGGAQSRADQASHKSRMTNMNRMATLTQKVQDTFDSAIAEIDNKVAILTTKQEDFIKDATVGASDDQRQALRGERITKPNGEIETPREYYLRMSQEIRSRLTANQDQAMSTKEAESLDRLAKTYEARADLEDERAQAEAKRNSALRYIASDTGKQNALNLEVAQGAEFRNRLLLSGAGALKMTTFDLRMRQRSEAILSANVARLKAKDEMDLAYNELDDDIKTRLLDQTLGATEGERLQAVHQGYAPADRPQALDDYQTAWKKHELAKAQHERAQEDGKFGDFERGQYTEVQKSMSNVSKAMEKLNEALDKGDQKLIEIRDHELKLAEARVVQKDALTNLQTIFKKVSGGEEVGIDNIQQRVGEYLDGIDTGRIESSGTAADLQDLRGALITSAKADAGVGRAMKEKEAKEKEFSLGSAARKLFGGFGLMYLRSVGNLVMEGTHVGEQEAIQQQALYEQMAARTFGTPYEATPERRLQNVMANTYAGRGARYLTGLQASLYENSPTLANLGSTALSGAGAFGATTWLMGEVLGMSAAAPMIAPFVGLAAAGASMYINYQGAVSQPDTTAVDIVRRQRAGTFGKNTQGDQWANALALAGGSAFVGGTIGSFLGPVGTAVGALAGGAIGFGTGWALNPVGGNKRLGSALLDPSLWASKYDPTVRQEAEILARAREMQVQSKGQDDIEAALIKQFGSAAIRGGRLTTMLSEVMSGKFQSIPSEALAQTGFFAAKYNMAPDQLANTVGTLYAAGIDVDQLSQTFLSQGGYGTGGYDNGTPMAGLWGAQIANSPLMQNEVSRSRILAGAELRSQLGINAAFETQPAASMQDAVQQELEMDERFGLIKGTTLEPVLLAAETARHERIRAGGKEHEPGDWDWNSKLTRARDAQGNYILKNTGPWTAANAFGVGQLPPNAYQMTVDPNALYPKTADGEQQQQADLARYEADARWWQQVGGVQSTLMTYYGMDYSTAVARTDRFNKNDWAGLSQYTQQIDFGKAVAEKMAMGGSFKGNQYKAMIEAYSAPEFAKVQPLYNMNPYALAAAYSQQNTPTGMMQLPGINGANSLTMADLAFVDVNQQTRMPTGLPWGTTSLARPGYSPMAVAKQIWGEHFQTGATGRALYQPGINAMMNGFTDTSGQTYYGMRGWQMQQLYHQTDLQQAQLGIQSQQFNLSYAFTTGIGLSAYNGITDPRTGKAFLGGDLAQTGGFWGLEDRQRALAHEQQTWQFDFQQRQMEMQERHWQQNTSLNRTQSLMQRGWTKEDWNYQDQTRAMNWQWSQEDFQEEVRFMTGRQRRLAERQMSRQTISHNMESDQIDKTRQRQETLWRLEDQRFILAKSQHAEELKMQQEQFQKGKEFYEQNKKLQDEQLELSRAYWLKQQELQKQSIGIQAQQIEEQKQVNETMMKYNWYLEDQQAKQNLINNETFPAFAEWLDIIIGIMKDAAGLGRGNDPAYSSSGSNSHYNGERVKGTNNLVWYWDGTSWTMIPEDQYNSLTGGTGITSTIPSTTASGTQSASITSGTSNPWANPSVSVKGSKGVANNVQTVVQIFIGNEQIDDFIVRSVQKAVGR